MDGGARRRLAALPLYRSLLRSPEWLKAWLGPRAALTYGSPMVSSKGGQRGDEEMANGDFQAPASQALTERREKRTRGWLS